MKKLMKTLLLVSILLFIGTVGALERNTIGMTQAIAQSAIAIVLLVLSSWKLESEGK